MATNDPQWLVIARELRAIAQTGLTFNADRFDRQRYDRVRELAASMLAQGSGADYGNILGVLLEDRGYATPKVDVRGAAFVESRVLLVREISDGKWTLPGGWDERPSHKSTACFIMRSIRTLLLILTDRRIGQIQYDAQAPAFAIDELNASAVGLGNFPSERKAQPGAAALGRIEG